MPHSSWLARFPHSADTIELPMPNNAKVWLPQAALIASRLEWDDPHSPHVPLLRLVLIDETGAEHVVAVRRTIEVRHEVEGSRCANQT